MRGLATNRAGRRGDVTARGTSRGTFTAAPAIQAGDAVLLEDGTSFLLLEDGTSKILLEA